MGNKQYVAGTYYSLTDIGKVRLTNEDRVVSSVNIKGNILLIVCDGMGGQNKGEYAAEMASKLINESFEQKQKFLNHFTAVSWVNKIVRKANREVYNESQRNPNYEGMGTTLTLVLIYHSYLISCQVGDSRAYILRNRQFDQITEDQSYVGYLYRIGKITKDEVKTHPKRHVLMNALGIFPSLNMDVRVRPYTNESVLVCSDGLYNNVEEGNIAAILKSDDTTHQKVHELISLANANGGSDNIAIALWEAKE